MRRLTILAACLSLAAHGEVIDATAKVTAATLYLKSADITREATVAIPQAGELTVRLKDIAVDDVYVEGAVLLHQAKEIPAKDTPPTELEQKLEKAQIHLKQVQSAFYRSTELGKALRKRLETQPDSYASVEELFLKLQQQHNTLIEQKAAAQEEIERLKQEVAKEKLHPSTLLTLRANQAGTAKIIIKQNQSHNARWQPSSEINLNTITGKVNLTAYATIYQQGDDDWENANITLAITPPVARLLPDAYPQVLNAISRKDISMPSPMMAREDAVVEQQWDISKNSAKMGVLGSVPNVPIEIQNGVDFVVKLPQQSSIKNHQEVRLSYYQHTIETKDLYSGIYQWNAPEALLVAKWQQPNVAFLAGDARFLRDGLQVYSQQFTDIFPANSEQVFSFGVDPSFNVQENETPQYTDSKGLINKDKQEEIRTTFIVNNLSGTKRPVKFFAILPTAGDANVTITPEWSSNPDEKNVDGVKGQMLWNVGTIAKDKPWTFNFGYNVKYPEEMILR